MRNQELYDFDTPVNRRNTGSYKWDTNLERFGRSDLLPFWVADMDFASPEPIIGAMRRRLEHPVFGYAARSESYYRSIINWLKTRHNWKVEKEWLTFCPPGVVNGINLLVNILTEPGDEILLQTPSYNPLIKVITHNNRILLRNDLLLNDGRYTVDFSGMRNAITDKTRLFILCSPHNPSGRVWRRNELEEMAEICLRNNITVISDEIHADFVYPGFTHVPFGSLSPEAASNSVTCFSASKTFNISGLQLATFIIPDPVLRRKYNEAVDTAQINLGNTLSEEAVEAAYTHCSDWVDQLISYLVGNLEYLIGSLAEHLPEVKVIRPEGTYLVWLDMRGLGLTSEEINNLLIHKAGVAIFEGKEFGEERSGFFRMNIACPRSQLAEGVKRITEVLKPAAF